MKKYKKNKIKNLKVSGSVKKEKKYSVDRLGSYAIIAISIIQIVTFSILPKLFYHPSIRELDTSNLFSENQVIISQEEQQSILEELEKKLGVKIDSNEENYLLLNAVLENPYLNAKEKEIFYKFIEYFNDNPFINREKIYENILNVDARFAFRSSLKEEENVLAVYLPRYRDIIYFSLFPTVDMKAHEDGHCITDARNIPRWLSEGVTQIITSEYFSDTPFYLTNTYPYEVSLVKLLCEMIGTDKILQAYTEDNSEIIYEALDDLIGIPGKSKTILEDLDWCIEAYSTGKIMTVEEDTKAGETLLAFLEYVNSCNYQDIDAFQYHLSVFISLFTDYYGTLKDYQKIVLCKAYLSSRLKEEGYDHAITVRTSDYLGESYQK